MKRTSTIFFMIFTLLVLSSFNSKNAFFDNNERDTYEIKKYSDKQIEGFVREVFLNEADKLVFNNSSRRLELFKNFLSRFDIQLHPEYKGKGFKNLSEIGLNDKFNKNLTRDEFMNVEKFNPLKYDFEMFSKKKQFFRFKNTDYIIVIEPIQ